MQHTRVVLFIIILACSFLTSCGDLPNSPYPEKDLDRNFLYQTFSTPPKTLDPAISYSSDEYAITGGIYEPPLHYHLLKRPYVLQPLVLREVPKPEYRKQLTVTATVENENGKFIANINKKQILDQISDKTKEDWKANGWEPGILSIENCELVSSMFTKCKVKRTFSPTDKDGVKNYVVAELPDGFDKKNITDSTKIYSPEFQLTLIENEEIYKSNEVDFEKEILLEVVKAKHQFISDHTTDENPKDNNQTKPKFSFKSENVFIITANKIKAEIDEIGTKETEIKPIENVDKSSVFMLSIFNIWVSSNEKESAEIFSQHKTNPDSLHYDLLSKQLKQGRLFPVVTPTGQVRVAYTMRVMPKIYYQPHPCFSKDKETGKFLFHPGKEPFFKIRKTKEGKNEYFLMQNGREIKISDAERQKLSGNPIEKDNLSSVFDMNDFKDVFNEYNPEESTRELTAADFVYQLKRWWNPKKVAQIVNVFAQYFIEPISYYKKLANKVLSIRKKRRTEQGIGYSQEADERDNPIQLDFELAEYQSAKVLDRYTYQVILNQPYPQLKYWFAMPFFCPFPWEADAFFNQGAMQSNNLTISRFPVGTGAYRLDLYDRQMEIRSIKNENFNKQGPENGTKPPVWEQIPFATLEANKNIKNNLILTQPLFSSSFETSKATGVDKNKNGKLDGSNDMRDYLVKNNFAELPFYDENGNGIYDGLRYWDVEEINSVISYEHGYIDNNGNGFYDEGERKFNIAEGVYFEDLNRNGIFEAKSGDTWYETPATSRTVYPYSGSKNTCPDELLVKVNELQKQADKLYVDFENNKEKIYELDNQIRDELDMLKNEYDITKEERSDYANSLLRDAGRRVPFIDAIVKKREKESTSYWTKFTQGYYELSGIGEDKFASIVNISATGAFLSDDLKKSGINLTRTPLTSVSYFAFNMTQNIWGWAEEFDAEEANDNWRKIRQAIAIVYDLEEFNDMFSNSRDMAAHGPIPPGIFGYEAPEEQTFLDKVSDLEYAFNQKIELKTEIEGEAKINDMTEDEINKWASKYSIFFNKFKDLSKVEKMLAIQQKYERNKDEYKKQGIKQSDIKFNPDDMLAEVHFGLNWIVYTWDKSNKTAKRRSVEEAKALLTEAGFQGGKNQAGTQLELKFLSMGADAKAQDVFAWRSSKLKKIGIQYKVEAKQYNQFQELANNGNFHSLGWGWNADYPDPENFLFLFLGPNHKAPLQNDKKFGSGGGENVANYWNFEFDGLFKQMSTMSDSPERLRIIRKMINIIRRDVPWIFENFRMSYVLYHHWYKNSKSNLMGHNAVWFRRINAEQRLKYRIDNNQPYWLPVIIFFVLIVVLILPGAILKHLRESKKTGKQTT